ncbi:MAG: GGDEF domain-containing protein [Lachnospiraceae bacterium]|nr:GGDEF domain-containing protein [Lachnospiraceae bacterium]
MGLRKRIGLFVSYPEITHVRRIMEGIMLQCRKYDYDLCVFASSIHLSFPHENYVRGESNIFNLANFDKLDGVILDSTTMTGDRDNLTSKKLLERLAAFKDIPKCALELTMEGTRLIESNNENVLREACRHVIEVHGRKKICILTGQQGNEVAEARLAIYLDEIQKYGLQVLPEHIVYGDFYYYSGDALARKIANNEISRPDAVICASDCMAMALIDRLVKTGIRVPEDIIVIGFDYSDEGAINLTSVASYEPSEKKMGADAVDYLRSVIEPNAELSPVTMDAVTQFHPGASYGCQVDSFHAMKQFRNYLYTSSFNTADEDLQGQVGLGTFMESYVMEGFTAAKTAEECISHIYNYADLLRPYRNFYLCLKENWQNIEDERYDGYPEKMRLYVANSLVGDEAFYGVKRSRSFSTSEMLPKLYEESENPSVYYFSPVHFDGKLLGFAVLQRELVDHPVINVIYRNWLRFVNNALEMIRAKERLQNFSVRDLLTGVYNRRGMYDTFASLVSEARDGDALFVSVVDMDGLKYINDTFGHCEGDIGIKTVCSTLSSIARDNEFCVRGGGDEFFLIGIGRYNGEDEAERAKEFSQAIMKASDRARKPYTISASIGCAVFEDYRQISLENALSEADERMYRYKLKNRRHRQP